MFNSLFLFSMLVAACSPFGTGEKERKMSERLLAGSDYQKNHELLSKEGWLKIFGDACEVNGVRDREYVYVRGADPSYSVTLTYDDGCKLESTTIKRREVNEL